MYPIIYIYTFEKYMHIYSMRAVLSLLTDKHVYVLVHVSVSLFVFAHCHWSTVALPWIFFIQYTQ